MVSRMGQDYHAAYCMHTLELELIVRHAAAHRIIFRKLESARASKRILAWLACKGEHRGVSNLEDPSKQALTH